LVFGEDGTLLVSAGDGATADTVDQGGNVSGSYAPQALTDGIIRAKEDIGALRSQLVDSLSGKVLRIDPATAMVCPATLLRRRQSEVGALTGVGIGHAKSISDVAKTQYGQSFSARRQPRRPLHWESRMEHVGMVECDNWTQAECWLAAV
jgi:hypothetical protein